VGQWQFERNNSGNRHRDRLYSIPETST
jgi:hypothetical protein